MPLRTKLSIKVTPQDIADARELGHGSAGAGIRLALAETMARRKAAAGDIAS